MLTNYDKHAGKQYLDSVVAEAVRLGLVKNEIPPRNSG
jgi:hypothetical protein